MKTVAELRQAAQTDARRHNAVLRHAIESSLLANGNATHGSAKDARLQIEGSAASLASEFGVEADEVMEALETVIHEWNL